MREVKIWASGERRNNWDMETIKLDCDIKEKNCKGTFFRYTYSSYISSHNSIEFRQSFRLLKKMSCPGCNNCQQIWKDFGMTGKVESTVQFPQNLIDNAIYEAVLVSVGYDSEGYCDDWWWELRKVSQ